MEDEEGTTGRPRRRWWMPLGIVVAWLGAWAGFEASEHVFRAYFVLMATLVAFVLLAIWGVFLSGLGRRGRWVAAVGVAVFVGIAGLVAGPLTRVEGSLSGGSLPRLVWSWAPERDGGVGALPVGAGAGAVESEVVDGRGMEVVWPGYLGVGRDGEVGAVRVVGDWDERAPELVWRRPIGAGWSSFAVAGGLALTQEYRGGDEVVSAYALETGEPVWAARCGGMFEEHFSGEGPRATPTVAGGVVYVQAATGELSAYRLADGSAIWSRDVLEDAGAKNQEYGKSNSPLLVGDLVVVTGGNDGEAGLLAYRSADGTAAWRGPAERPSFSSPTVMELGGEVQVVVVNAESVTGHDPASGAVLWRFEWPGRYPKVAQPQQVGDDAVLVTASYGAGSRLIGVSRTGDGGWDAEAIWESRRMKTKFSSAVVAGGYAYGLDEGRMSCVSLDDGERVWREGKYGYGQNLLVGGDVLVAAEDGRVVLVEATAEGLNERGAFQAIEGMTWNVPALADDLLLVRNGEEAACYRLEIEAVGGG